LTHLSDFVSDNNGDLHLFLFCRLSEDDVLLLPSVSPLTKKDSPLAYLVQLASYWFPRFAIQNPVCRVERTPFVLHRLFPGCNVCFQCFFHSPCTISCQKGSCSHPPPPPTTCQILGYSTGIFLIHPSPNSNSFSPLSYFQGFFSSSFLQFSQDSLDALVQL